MFRSISVVLIIGLAAAAGLGACKGPDGEHATPAEAVPPQQPEAAVETVPSHGKPLFMSADHVRAMNRLLDDDPEVRAATAALDRRYILAYELDHGPQGRKVWWTLTFDPVAGLAFSLEPPGAPADLTLRGEYPPVIRTMRAIALGEQEELPVTATGDESIMAVIGPAFAAGQNAATIDTAFPDVDTFVLQTDLGRVEITLDREAAPISAANFEAYVDGGYYDGASFYRAARDDNWGAQSSAIYIVQGGLLGERYATALESGDLGSLTLESALPPIAHETTIETGLRNERGVIAWGRLAPGTATSEFFVNLAANPGLDSGDTSRNPDGRGYATFGRVTKGLEILDEIQQRPTGTGALAQVLVEPVTIRRAYRK